MTRLHCLLLLLLVAILAGIGSAVTGGCYSAPPAEQTQITELQPSRATAGGSSFPLKVIGKGFQSTDLVLWKGAPLATQPVSSTELDAQVPSALIADPGTATITVDPKPFGGGGPSNSVTFIINSGAPQTVSLTVAKTHTGNFTQGQNGATYTITVSNGGTGSTSGTVTVSDSLPTGLTPVSATGSGWTCTITVTCTRSNPLAPDNSYPAITLTVNVASNAPSSVTNTVTVSGGGDPNSHTANDATNITTAPAASLTIAKAHTGNFTQGQAGATYTITVGNQGTGSTGGMVTATDTVPNGLTATAASGTGWACTIFTTVTCTRSDPLASGSSYPAVTLTVNVASNAPSNITNTVTISGGGDPNSHSANDATNITTAPTASLTITKTHTGNFTQGQTGATYTITVSNGGTGSTSGTVTVSDSLPTGLTPVSATGSGWTCTITVTCTRSDPLVPGNSYPAITLTVDVASNAPSSVTNTVTISGGGSSSSSASDMVIITVSGPTGNAIQVTFGNGDVFGPFVYSDPLISFSSLATDLVPNDTNGQLDVFVACIVGGTLTNCPTPIMRASLTSTGAQIPGGAGPSPSTGPTSPAPISGDGRFVVFASSDPNVVTPPTPPGVLEVYVRDTCFGASGCAQTTFLASVSSTAIGGKDPSISANGRAVAFQSGFQINARDTCFGAPAGCTPSTVLVSADNIGARGNIFSDHPSAGGDGRFVSFESNSNNLVPTASSIQQQIFLRDTCIGAAVGCTPKTTLISANSIGSPSNSFNQSPSVNSDGRFTVFFSQASDILPGNTAPGSPDVFLRDTCAGSSGPVAGCTPSTIRVSIALDGTQANGGSITGGPGTSISSTGRFVAFGSAATNLLPTPSTTGQVYVLDTCFGAPAGCTRALHKVTVDSSGNELGSSGQFGLSGDGKYLAFTKLVGTAPNQIQQVFLALTGF